MRTYEEVRARLKDIEEKQITGNISGLCVDCIKQTLIWVLE